MENSPQKTSIKLKFEKIMEKIPTNTELEQIINEQGPLSSIALIELQERRKEQAMQQKPVQGTVAQRVVDDMNAQKQAQMMGIAQMQPQINPDEISPEMINALGRPKPTMMANGGLIGLANGGTPFSEQNFLQRLGGFANPFREDFGTDFTVGRDEYITKALDELEQGGLKGAYEFGKGTVLDTLDKGALFTGGAGLGVKGLASVLKAAKKSGLGKKAMKQIEKLYTKESGGAKVLREKGFYPGTKALPRQFDPVRATISGYVGGKTAAALLGEDDDPSKKPTKTDKPDKGSPKGGPSKDDPLKGDPSKEGGKGSKGLGLGLSSSLNPLLTILAGDAIRRGEPTEAQNLLKTGQAIQASKDARALDQEKLDIAREELGIKKLTAQRANALTSKEFLTQRLKFFADEREVAKAQEAALKDIQRTQRVGFFNSIPDEEDIRNNKELSKRFNELVDDNLNINFAQSIFQAQNPLLFATGQMLPNMFQGFTIEGQE